MPAITDGELSSSSLARRAVMTTAALALAGSALGLIGILKGVVAGAETLLVLSCLVFSLGLLVALLVFRTIALQTVATISTVYFALYLCAGAFIAVGETNRHADLFVYLVWFFPLLVYNKLVNSPAAGRALSTMLLLAPLLIVGLLAARLTVIFTPDLLFVVAAFCLSYLGYGLALNTVTRYREEYIVERERAESLKADIMHRKGAEARIQRLAFYDALTGLPNRLLLREKLADALATAAGQAAAGALLLIDLDDFKTLNDTLGHETGDVLLGQVAQRLASCVPARACVARFGGDEFGVLLEGLSADAAVSTAQVGAAGEAILAAFGASFAVGNYDCKSTASIGITLFGESDDSVDELLTRADLAMYRAKALGRDTLCFFDPAMRNAVLARVALKSDLQRAVQNREFELHYQPQVDTDGHVVGAEALLRWPHPERGFVPPDEFIPLAEEDGLIVELGRWVLETACGDLARWALDPKMNKLKIAVNVSLRQLIDSNFVKLVLDVLAESGADPHRLKLEITESCVMENVNDTIAKMTALQAHGVGFSLDDFGTGYASLSHLKRLPLDQLKIDRSFVKDVLTDVKDASIARTIITLGHNLGMAVIAEGVETQGQCDFLEREGCRSYQGYLFSPALNSVRFAAFVAAAPARREAVHA